jgi:hypothetical protein
MNQTVGAPTVIPFSVENDANAGFVELTKGFQRW